jgi:L-alanine-DL-glutamate epimerase-like enolase superfamily enzyme
MESSALKTAVSRADPVAEVDARISVVKLPNPISIGGVELTQRSYVLVTVTTATGWVGHAYGLSRELPIDEIVRGLAADHVVGRDSDRIVELRDTLKRATMVSGRTGAVAKAIGLLDIALWDAKAQRAGLPLWRLLGGGRATNQAMLIAAYPDATRDVDELVEDVLGYAQRGFRLLKIARDPDTSRMIRWLERLTAELPRGVRLVVDCGWAYRTPAEALAELSEWPKAPVAWVEDPLPPEDAGAYAYLRRRSPFPIGAGDEVADLHVLRELLRAEAIDVLRVDAASVGVTGASEAAVLAASARIPVSYHVYPEVSAHLAAARAEGAIVESFDPDTNRYDSTRVVVHGGALVTGDSVTAPEDAGLGIRFVQPAGTTQPLRGSRNQRT